MTNEQYHKILKFVDGEGGSPRCIQNFIIKEFPKAHGEAVLLCCRFICAAYDRGHISINHRNGEILAKKPLPEPVPNEQPEPGNHT